MSKIDSALYSVDYLERLSYLDSMIHRLDPRAKIITTLAFIFCVVSSDKYEISGLLLFFLYPVIIAALSAVPFSYLMKNLLIVSPFAFFVGAFNPLFDQKILLHIGDFSISGGWISFLSILIRFALTVSAAFILIATTGFFRICSALERLRVPRVFVLQLMFLYRYIFVLIEEAGWMVKARALRSFNGKGKGMKATGSLIGQLLLRSIERARSIHQAMLSRGFKGDIGINKAIKFRLKDLLYILLWVLFFIASRTYNIPRLLGELLRGLAS